MDFPFLSQFPDLNKVYELDFQGYIFAKPIFKRHTFKKDSSSVDKRGFNPFSDMWDNLALLIRDPIECISRQLHAHETSEFHDRFPEEIETFLHNLDTYENWLCKKQIFYYEDMINQPALYFTQLGNFFNAREAMVRLFLENYEYHREQGVRMYHSYSENHEQSRGSITKGTKTKYYEEFLPKNILSKSVKEIKASPFYEKYLSRYSWSTE